MIQRSRPVVTLLPDYPNWAFDFIARSIANRLSHRFRFRIEYASRHPWITGSETDLLYVFFWGYKIPDMAGFSKHQIIKDVASWGWMLPRVNGELAKVDFVARYLNDCGVATTPCARLFESLHPVFPNMVHCPNGVEHLYFSSGFYRERPKGPLKIGWVGNPADEHKVKGLHEILIPAAKSYDFVYTHGSMTRRELRRFYAGIDVLAIASKSESQPLPLLEAMSAGCFPVCTDVGIVPELIVEGSNGRIVQRTVDAFADAFHWCEQNLDHIRSNRESQTAAASSQDWDVWSGRFGDLFEAVLNRQEADASALPASLRRAVNRTARPTTRRDNRIGPDGRRFLPQMNCARMDLLDTVRRWFLGDRFHNAPGDTFYRLFSRQARWGGAIYRRFSELVRERGFLGALATSVKSALKRDHP